MKDKIFWISVAVLVLGISILLDIVLTSKTRNNMRNNTTLLIEAVAELEKRVYVLEQLRPKG